MKDGLIRIKRPVDKLKMNELSTHTLFIRIWELNTDLNFMREPPPPPPPQERALNRFVFRGQTIFVVVTYTPEKCFKRINLT